MRLPLIKYSYNVYKEGSDIKETSSVTLKSTFPDGLNLSSSKVRVEKVNIQYLEPTQSSEEIRSHKKAYITPIISTTLLICPGMEIILTSEN